MARGISLQREGETKVEIPNRGDGWRIRITASAAEGMPNAVFGMREQLIDPHSGLTRQEFCFVASPEDLVIYPVGVPDITQTPPYFRVATIDVIVASRHIADLLWTEVQTQVCILVTALDKKEVLSVAETTRCGDPVTTPETSISQSISTSLSVSVSQP